jgi:hypothetical protein
MPATTRKIHMSDTKGPLDYAKPTVSDYGDLQELTATNTTGNSTDVPFGTPVPPFSIFS